MTKRIEASVVNKLSVSQQHELLYSACIMALQSIKIARTIESALLQNEHQIALYGHMEGALNTHVYIMSAKLIDKSKGNVNVERHIQALKNDIPDKDWQKFKQEHNQIIIKHKRVVTAINNARNELVAHLGDDAQLENSQRYGTDSHEHESFLVDIKELLQSLPSMTREPQRIMEPVEIIQVLGLPIKPVDGGLGTLLMMVAKENGYLK